MFTVRVKLNDWCDFWWEICIYIIFVGVWCCVCLNVCSSISEHRLRVVKFYFWRRAWHGLSDSIVVVVWYYEIAVVVCCCRVLKYVRWARDLIAHLINWWRFLSSLLGHWRVLRSSRAMIVELWALRALLRDEMAWKMHDIFYAIIAAFFPQSHKILTLLLSPSLTHKD